LDGESHRIPSDLESDCGRSGGQTRFTSGDLAAKAPKCLACFSLEDHTNELERVFVLKAGDQKMSPIFYLFIGIFVGIDIVTKRVFDSVLYINESVVVIPGWFKWHLIHNKGASFGILSSFTDLWTVLSFMIIILILYVFFNLERKAFPVRAGFAALIGGAIGNFLDRIGQGYVVDFLDFRLWPAIFNIADIEIRTGMLILIILFIKDREQFKTKQNRFYLF
jgi:signal peptidase II